MNEQETIVDIIAEKRFHGQQNIDAEKDKPEYGILTVEGEIALNYADRLDAAKLRERRLLMSCARWILCHNIYGHIAKELLAECKEVLNDDGQFLFKEDEQ